MGDNRPGFASQNPRLSDYVMGRRGWDGGFSAKFGMGFACRGQSGFNAAGAAARPRGLSSPRENVEDGRLEAGGKEAVRRPARGPRAVDLAKKTPGVFSPEGPKGAAQKRHLESFSPRARPAVPHPYCSFSRCRKIWSHPSPGRLDRASGGNRERDVSPVAPKGSLRGGETSCPLVPPFQGLGDEKGLCFACSRRSRRAGTMVFQAFGLNGSSALRPCSGRPESRRGRDRGPRSSVSPGIRLARRLKSSMSPFPPFLPRIPRTRTQESLLSFLARENNPVPGFFDLRVPGQPPMDILRQGRWPPDLKHRLQVCHDGSLGGRMGEPQ